MNAVACLAWVRQGIAKQHPERVKLDGGDLKNLLEKGQQLESEEDEENALETSVNLINESSHQEASSSMVSTSEGHFDEDDIAQKYGFDNYDDTDEEENEDEAGNKNPLRLAGVAMYSDSKNDPYMHGSDTDTDDEELEISINDNMLAVGKVHGEYCNLEIYVYNEQDSNLYVHHDILLSSFPLCVEWMDFDPGEPSPGNMVAVGSMAPDIEIWDLDVVDIVEPAFVLAGALHKKGKKKKKTSIKGHTDAVLDLAWNHHQRNVLGSASADFTIGLWDLEQGALVTSLKQHTEKVQALQWHPFESQSLLSGSFDKTAKVFDCRSPDDAHKTWSLPGEVERVLWNHHEPYYFLASTDTGHVHYMDVRNVDPVFTLKAHHGAVSGIALSSTVPGCLVSCSADKVVKVWDIRENKPNMVLKKNMKMGELQCVRNNPNTPLTFAVGGEREMRVVNMQTIPKVCKHFGVKCSKSGSSLEVEASDDFVEDDDIGLRADESEKDSEDDMPSNNTATATENKKGKKRKKRKKKLGSKAGNV